MSTTPFVGEDESRDSYSEDNDSGNSRSEERSFRGRETGLCKEKGCILDYSQQATKWGLNLPT